MLLSFGSNGRGQLSLSHSDDVSVPTPCIHSASSPSSITPPKRIAGGGNHTLVLFQDGELYATGDNTYSQCIPPNRTPSELLLSTFHHVPDPPSADRWKFVSAGWNFTIKIAENGNVYSAGHGPKGELGLGPEQHSVGGLIRDFPPEGTRIERIDSGMAHTVVVLSNGHVYGWGAGRKGQLGSPPDAVVDRPRRIMVDWAVEYAVCGRESTFLVEMVESPEMRMRVLLLGTDKFGIRDAMGMSLEGRVTGVDASWNSVYVHYDDGRLVGYGRNDKGQLPPEGLGVVERFAAGSEHVVAVVDRKLVAWGWGEHGNCGKKRDEPGGGDVVGVVEEVKVPGIKDHASGRGQIKRVGAGCATSWVWVGALEGR